VPHNLISAQESPVPLPKFHVAPRLKISMSSGSKKEPRYTIFSLRKFRQANPLQVPQQGPCGERYLLMGHFYVSLNISLFIFPLESLVWEPPPRSLTGFPWMGILRHQSHWSIYLSIHSFIHVCLPSPQKGVLLHMGKNLRSPSMGSSLEREGLHTMGYGLVPQGNR
jgi:hypothetical protein